MYTFSELFFIPRKDKPATQRSLLLMTTKRSLVPLLIQPEAIYFRVKNKIGNKMKESPYLFNSEPCIHSYLNNLMIKSCPQTVMGVPAGYNDPLLKGKADLKSTCS